MRDDPVAAFITTRLRLAKPRRLRHQWPVHMDIERDGNLIEAGVWFLLAITLAVFGGSDLVEARTGAWWKPWWLFVWKAACVVVLLLAFIRYYRLTKGQKPQIEADEGR